ncbi:MAG: T9SS type B sorting domain-containing protein [Sphingobacteriaceae bacterium]|nr:MAG: T9SS type B sorting domain-containing protein [Sphingobacteriaceae bacterium]
MIVNKFPCFVAWLILMTVAFTNIYAKSTGPTQVVTICQGSFTVLNAATQNAAAYQWYLNGQPIAGAYEKGYAAGKAGNYTVVAYNQQSCASDVSDAIQVDVTASAGITFDPLADKTIGDAPFQLKVVSAKNNINYTASPAGIVTIQNDIVTIIGAGTVTITATSPGKNSCGGEITATQTLKVNSSVIKNVSAKTNVVDLALVNSSESKQVSVDQSFEYTLMVKNQSSVNATYVTVTDTLPANISFAAINGTAEGKATYNAADRVLTWKMDLLKGGAYAELHFTVTALRHGTIKNTVKAVSAEEDSNPLNNTAIDYKDIAGINIPNVFTPNGDGRNDTFTIPDLVQYQQNELVILNRWGAAVYQTKNYQNNWTGDKLDDGTYFYSLKVKNSKGEQEEYKGYITMLHTAI